MLTGDYVDVFERRGMGYDVDEHDLEVAQGEGWGGSSDEYSQKNGFNYEGMDDLMIWAGGSAAVPAKDFEAAVREAEYHLMFDSLPPEAIVSVLDQADLIEAKLSRHFEELSDKDREMDAAIQTWVEAEVNKNEATAAKNDIMRDQHLVALDSLMTELRNEVVELDNDAETAMIQRDQQRFIELVQARREEAMVHRARELYELAA